MTAQVSRGWGGSGVVVWQPRHLPRTAGLRDIFRGQPDSEVSFYLPHVIVHRWLFQCLLPFSAKSTLSPLSLDPPPSYR